MEKKKMSSEENDEIEEVEEELQRKKAQKREPDEVIQIQHIDDRNKPLTKNERLEYENLQLVVEAEALKQFETEKENLLQNIPESRRKKLKDFISDDPDKLQQVKASLILQGQDFDDDEDDEEEITPAGRARLPPDRNSNQRSQSRNQMYDNNPTIQKYSDLYAIIRNPKSTQEQKAEAEQILDETFAEIRKGLRNRSKSNPYQLPTGVVNHCMKCGFVTEIDLSKGTPCPNCGFKFGIDDFPRNPKFQPR